MLLVSSIYGGFFDSSLYFFFSGIIKKERGNKMTAEAESMKVEEMKKIVMRVIKKANAEVSHLNMPYKMDNSAIHGRLRNSKDSLSSGQVMYTTRVLAEEGKLKKVNGPVVQFMLPDDEEDNDNDNEK
jgi:hypothetical protein